MTRVAIGLFAVILASCATEVESPVRLRPDAVRAELLDHIDAGHPERAVQRITALRREEVLPPNELDSFLGDAVDSIRREYDAAREEGRPRDALRAYNNLVVLGVEERDTELVSRLYAEYAEDLAADGNEPAALSVFLRAPSLSSLPEDALARAASIAVGLNNRHAASLLVEVLGRDWRGENPDVVGFASGETNAVEMSEGVVTVWVNRGIRLESGMGVPDRVIGSGFFIDPRGYIVTNYHVISSEVDPEYEGYSRLYVRLPADPDTRIPARVVGYSRIFDVALLKIEVDAPYVFSFTDIRSLEPGSRIMAIGSPGGLENSVTSGIISAVGRRFLQMGDAMQVDVPINPGSSGGPLLDRQGRLVGVVFAGIEQFEGVNFAIPSYWVHSFLPDLYDGGEVVVPWMGVAVERRADGLEVSYVANDSPADEAGIVVGDVLTRFGEWPARDISAAQSYLLSHEPGSLIELEWLRDGDATRGLLSLVERPSSPVEEALEADLHDRLYPVLFGMRVRRIGGFSLRQNYRITRVYPGSVADETGITAGDTFVERDFDFDDELDIVYLRMFIQKRTEGFMQTGIQLGAYVERDNLL
ncbi:MAG: trypsin-like peptidase domain-containing protein [Spirochaetota bacterium]